jgi:hypothetical protein
MVVDVEQHGWNAWKDAQPQGNALGE